ncbi:MAG: VOC family protein, partial [candidate division NC10 bacterium]
MLLGIDHLVVAVPDLDTAIRGYTELGFTVVPGGRHPVGTHNALISFADGSYLELIAFYEPSPDHRWWAPLQKGGGLVDFCMQTDDLRGDTAVFRQAGVAIDDPKPLSRVRP